mmetsp:Transcript_27525/g.70753  ORF Transcript_27525/g.70753 Transcript_27525/m.70753 type:complete len:328 (-) Transcript_27525:98-1081(-)|eukprot:jgi/Tetstr1/420714/TSEL_011797.t1
MPALLHNLCGAAAVALRGGLLADPPCCRYTERNNARPSTKGAGYFPLHVFASIACASGKLLVLPGTDIPRQKVNRHTRGTGDVDVVLSSGFLSFANHSGFLEAVEENGFKVKAIMGTSAGALTGSLYAAGYTPKEVAFLLSKDPPYKLLRLAWPWEGGLLSMKPAINRLKELLPPTFEELPTEFACGVVCRDGSHRVINSGALPEAVVASAAIPVLFAPVRIPGQGGGPFKDGGKVDRIGLKQWRDFLRSKSGKPEPPALVHLIGRSSPFSGNDNICGNELGVTVVRCPKSGVSLFSLGDFNAQRIIAKERASAIISKKRPKRFVFF